MYPKIYFFRSKNTPFLQIFQMCNAYSLLKLKQSIYVASSRRISKAKNCSPHLHFFPVSLFIFVIIHMKRNKSDNKFLTSSCESEWWSLTTPKITLTRLQRQLHIQLHTFFITSRPTSPPPPPFLVLHSR